MTAIPAAHTPGPWQVTSFVDGRPNGSDHHTYKVTPQRGVYGSLFEADAHLCAAAPDLLAALETFVAEYVALVESGDAGFWDAEMESKVIAARAAISKANGYPNPAREA